MDNSYYLDENFIDSYIEANKFNILKDIADFVRIPSISEKGYADAPYGSACKEVLKLVLSRSKAMGLTAENIDNRLACVSIPGQESTKFVATVTHLDVVPAGDGWKADPFEMRTIGDYIIGRGVSDDKGPSVICLYALKFFLENNIKLRYGIKSILGLSEETGMDDVKWFLSHRKAPDFAFSPDADFPLCNGEKGIYHAELVSKYSLKEIKQLSGGEVINAVPGDAYAVLCRGSSERVNKINDVPNYISISATREGDIKITSKGVSAHASTPEKGINAVYLLTNFLLENGIILNTCDREIISYIREITSSTNGSAQKISCSDNNFGNLTLLGSKIRLANNSVKQSIDCRYPTSISGKQITAALQEAYGNCFDVSNIEDETPFYISPDSPAIKACLAAYNEVQNTTASPMTISGGTYARNFPYAVAFGPVFPDENKPEYIGSMHGPEEGTSITQLLKALKIYIKALLGLQCLEDF